MDEEMHSKIFIPTDNERFPTLEGEWVWAVSVDEKRNEFKVDNIPFYAYGISNKDLVGCTDTEDGKVFARIIKRSGHSTYRALLPKGSTHRDFMALWPNFESLGCSFEATGSAPFLYAIDVPPMSDIGEFYRRLQQAESMGYFTFEEAHYFDADNPI